jgi:hypothetical protein
MITALLMEFYKVRRRKIGLTISMIIGVQALWILLATRNMDAHKLSQGWMSCIYSFSQINCITMPIAAAVIASRLSDIEHKGTTFKLLKAIMPSNQLFIAKFLCGTFYMAIMVLLQIGTIIFTGYLRGFTQQFPLNYLGYFAVFTFLVNLTVVLLQFILSLLYINQMIAFIVAITGSFLGLYSLFFKNIAKFVLWGYYGVLAPVGMNWDRATRKVDLYWASIPVGEILLLFITFIVLYIVGKKLFIEKEA